MQSRLESSLETALQVARLAIEMDMGVGICSPTVRHTSPPPPPSHPVQNLIVQKNVLTPEEEIWKSGWKNRYYLNPIQHAVRVAVFFLLLFDSDLGNFNCFELDRLRIEFCSCPGSIYFDFEKENIEYYFRWKNMCINLYESLYVYFST